MHLEGREPQQFGEQHDDTVSWASFFLKNSEIKMLEIKHDNV